MSEPAESPDRLDVGGSKGSRKITPKIMPTLANLKPPATSQPHGAGKPAPVGVLSSRYAHPPAKGPSLPPPLSPPLSPDSHPAASPGESSGRVGVVPPAAERICDHWSSPRSLRVIGPEHKCSTLPSYTAEEERMICRSLDSVTIKLLQEANCRAALDHCGTSSSVASSSLGPRSESGGSKAPADSQMSRTSNSSVFDSGEITQMLDSGDFTPLINGEHQAGRHLLQNEVATRILTRGRKEHVLLCPEQPDEVWPEKPQHHEGLSLSGSGTFSSAEKP